MGPDQSEREVRWVGLEVYEKMWLVWYGVLLRASYTLGMTVSGLVMWKINKLQYPDLSSASITQVSCDSLSSCSEIDGA